MSNPDSFTPKLKSPYVTQLVQFEAVYVCGPSSLSGLLLGQSQLLCAFDSDEQLQDYLVSILVYLVASGQHSWHEVLSMAQDFMGCVADNYPYALPTDEQAVAPQFALFIDSLCARNKAYQRRFDEAWKLILTWFNDLYCPQIAEMAINNQQLVSLQTHLQSFEQAMHHACDSAASLALKHGPAALLSAEYVALYHCLSIMHNKTSKEALISCQQIIKQQLLGDSFGLFTMTPFYVALRQLNQQLDARLQSLTQDYLSETNAPHSSH